MKPIPNSKKRNKILILFLVIFLLGIFLRVFKFGEIPAGLNQDEVSAAYEAISLSSSGLDRWGNQFPAYFISWGSGQNALLSYLDIPIFLIAGVSNLTIRFWPLIFGILTIPLVFWIVNKTIGKKTALFSSLVISISPLFVMTSRWALESNLMPFLQALGVALLIKFKDSLKTRWLFLSVFAFILAGYAYIISIPLSIILILSFMLIYRKDMRAKLKYIIASLILIIILWSPLLLLIIKNYIVKNTLLIEQILPFSLPFFTEQRIIQTQASSVIEFFKFIYHGFNDFSLHNAIPGISPIINRYLLFVLMFFGFGKIFKMIFKFKTSKTRLNPIKFFIWAWILLSFLYYSTLSVFINPNITRTNGLYIPLVILISIGLVSLVKFSKIILKKIKNLILIIIFIILSFSTYNFISNYFNTYPKQIEKSFFVGFSTLLKRITETSNGELIYISDNITFNYLQTAFYLNISSAELREKSTFEGLTDISKFNNYIFNQNVLNKGQKIYFIEFDKEPTICGSLVKILYTENKLVGGSCVVNK